jgi:hypothetical protein
MASTAIVAVRKALVAAVTDLPAFADVEVMYAWQGTTGREFAYTREAKFDHGPAALKAGRNFREEDGSFEFVIWIESVGGTPEEANDRALELGLPFEEYVADNKTGAALAVTGLKWIEVRGSGSLREAPADQGSVAELVYPIAYQARLT